MKSLHLVIRKDSTTGHSSHSGMGNHVKSKKTEDNLVLQKIETL